MTTPRRSGWWMLILGGVGSVLGGAFALAWWKLPEWQPDWVIKHSPWVEPAVRAMVASRIKEKKYLLRALEWGPSAGPLLRQHFVDGSEYERWQVMAIARALVKPVGDLKNVTAIQEMFSRRHDGSYMSEADAIAWRDHLGGLARDACAAGGDYPWLVMGVMAVAYEPDFGPVLWKQAAARLGQYDLDSVTDIIAHVRDPAAVRGLMPLFIAPVEESDRIDLGGAMHDSLAKDQVAEVVAAMRHAHPRVRQWGIRAIWWVDPNDEALALLPGLMSDPDLEVRREAFDSGLYDRLTPELLANLLAGLRDADAEIRTMCVKSTIARKVPSEFRTDFLARLHDPDPEIRRLVIEAIVALRLVDGGSPLTARLEPGQELMVRQLARTVGDPARGVAILALGRIGDVSDVALLLGLLQDDDRVIAHHARIALGHLPLTSEQRRQIDAVYDARKDLSPAPTSTGTQVP